MSGDWQGRTVGLLVAGIVVVCVVLGDARPGFCPFSEPTPGAGIRFPATISPPQAIPPVPAPALYPVFDRPREVQPGVLPSHRRDGPAMVAATGRPNAWGKPVSRVPTSHWMGNPLWTTSACLLIFLIGLLPLAWMYLARNQDLPQDLAPSPRWRGWTRS